MLTEDEFIDLYKKGYSRACSIFLRTGLPPDLCDDVAQDMYLRMWEYRHWKTDSYTPLTFWYLNLRHALCKIVPAYKAGETYIVTNSDALEFIKEHYPDPHDMTFQADMESLLSQLPEELATGLLAKMESGSLQDACDLLDHFGYRDKTRGIDAHRMKMKRLRESDEVKAIIKEYYGRD
jgi:DNA-directed RNA polymerase specialized sigma24 family protein